MSDDAAQPATCPFRGLMERVGLSSPRGEQAAAAATAPSGVCPFSGATRVVGGGADASSSSPPSSMANSTSTSTSTKDATSTAGGGGGVCPLGFGRSKPGGPPLTALHCPRCKSLFHDCVLLSPCGHRFCGSCFKENTMDCLACGADVASRARDEEAQRSADAALEDAARADREGAAQAWLRAAMSSAAGGNHEAALARSTRAEEELKKEEEEEEEEEEQKEEEGQERAESEKSAAAAAAAAAARRAAVSGVIGDSHRCLGDVGAARRRYEGAVAVLEEALLKSSSSTSSTSTSTSTAEANGSPSSPSQRQQRRELTRALTVTLNKLGDLLYSSGGIEDARPLYARALALRLEAAGVSEEQARQASTATATATATTATATAKEGDKDIIVAIIAPADEGDAERASDLIDAGLSAAKVADADAAAAAAGSAGTEEEEAAAAARGAGFRLAAALLEAGAAGAAAAGGPLAARAERLRAFLESSKQL